MASTSTSSARTAKGKQRAVDTPDHEDQDNEESIESYEDWKRRLLGHFHLSGVAYVQRGKTFSRFYCKACLENVIADVKQAREQFAPGRDTSVDILTSIALGRMQFFTSKQTTSMLKHLRRTCNYVKQDVRKEAAQLHRLSSSRDAYRNPYDFGSLYEVVEHPKYAGNDPDLLVPGSASPAQIYASHERAHLKRLKKNANDSKHKKKRLKRIAIDKQQTQSRENAGLGGETTGMSLSEGESDEERNAPVFDAEEVEKLLFDGVDDGEMPEMPADFPSSDLLKTLQHYAGAFYASRGLMQTGKKPRDENGEKIPSMIQKLDGSALIALGILAQELVKSQVNTERPVEPPEDTMASPGNFAYAYARQQRLRGRRRRSVRNETIDAILERLPYGSTIQAEDLLEEMPPSKKTKEPGDALSDVEEEDEEEEEDVDIDEEEEDIPGTDA